MSVQSETQTAAPQPTTSEPQALLAEQALTVRHLTPLDAAFFVMYALMLVLHVLAAWLAIGWASAAAMDVLLVGYLALLAWKRQWRPLLLRLLILGLVAGICELATDAAGESFAHSLIYPANEPMLWASPLYMPVSWMIVLTLLGYLGWRLRELAPSPPRWVSIPALAIAGALTVPFYEEMAYHAGWWRYVPVHNLGHTPLYVLCFEGAIAALLPLIMGGLLRRSLRHAAWLGVIVGAWMPVVALISWLLLGRN